MITLNAYFSNSKDYIVKKKKNKKILIETFTRRIKFSFYSYIIQIRVAKVYYIIFNYVIVALRFIISNYV